MQNTSSDQVKSFNKGSRLILVAVLVCCNFGCTEKNELIKIFPLQSNSTALTARVIKSIPLSNQVEAVIGSIDKLVISKDRIYVLDKYQAKGLLIFSETGQFLKKVQRGRGPGELILRMSWIIAAYLH